MTVAISNDTPHRACVVIPVYNHDRRIGLILDRTSALGLFCIVVDDGSDESCRQALGHAANGRQNVDLMRHSPNRGKGFAVGRGLARARELGYTHALQIDADGQHDLDDIPKFLDTSRQHPHDVISGSRDNSLAPRGRRYGRLLTDVWVWINTLSTALEDSMCGYRVYPVDVTLDVIEHDIIGNRMDFDIEILVRLYWTGVHTRYIETRIEYADDMVSHFDMLRDNLLISRTHAALFFGMLMRLPRLLSRRPPDT